MKALQLTSWLKAIEPTKMAAPAGPAPRTGEPANLLPLGVLL